MFHGIPRAMQDRMKFLEESDARDRKDGTAHQKRLRQIPPETGRFLALLAASAPEGKCIEIGASAGYSTLWLALACRQMKRKVITCEVLAEKQKLARETFRLADVEDVVELISGDARDFLPELKDISFCFLDAEKDIYQECYDMLIPNLIQGGILVADNVISHQEKLQPLVDSALADTRVDSLVVPIGKGELVCRKI